MHPLRPALIDPARQRQRPPPIHHRIPRRHPPHPPHRPMATRRTPRPKAHSPAAPTTSPGSPHHHPASPVSPGSHPHTHYAAPPRPPVAPAPTTTAYATSTIAVSVCETPGIIRPAQLDRPARLRPRRRNRGTDWPQSPETSLEPQHLHPIIRAPEIMDDLPRHHPPHLVPPLPALHRMADQHLDRDRLPLRDPLRHIQQNPHPPTPDTRLA